MVRAFLAMLLAFVLGAPDAAHARTAQARIARVVTPAATMEGVRVRLEWQENAATGTLRLRADRLDAPAVDQQFTAVDWQCTLRRAGPSAWRCVGPVRSSTGSGARLAISLGERGMHGELASGARRIAVAHDGAGSDATRIDLAAVPLAWMRALLSQAWPDAAFSAGEMDARLRVTDQGSSLRIAGPLSVRDASFDTPDGRIAAQSVDLAADIDLLLGARDRVRLDGRLSDGEALFGTTYIDLGGRSAGIVLEAREEAGGWLLPSIEWRDGDALFARGSATFGPEKQLQALDITARSADLSAARDAYLGGWLGAAGLGGLEMRGGVEGRVVVDQRGPRLVDAVFGDVSLRDAEGRFRFDQLDGTVRFSGGDEQVGSDLGWAGGSLYGLEFGAARVPLSSSGGELAARGPIALPILGGQLRMDHLVIRPPADGESMRMGFGLELDGLDVGTLAAALGWPAFTGELSGRIPVANYRRNVLTFDGGLAMQVFGGRVDVSSLSMERPFGVAPTLSADVRLNDLDLEALTGVLGFGSITGLLDGRIDGLRLVDWQPVAFDAALATDPGRGVRQRISQRAVQDLSSVGDASFVTSLQARLLGFFDDFGYDRIGIGCRLVDQVCHMDGLDSAGRGFSIVRGAGIPRLSVVGYNRQVDWPTLVDRLLAASRGEATPVVD